jgi:hypothetical protein
VGRIRDEFDYEKLTHTITTEQGESFVLDVTTGRLLRHVSCWPRYVTSFVLLVPTLVALIWYRPWIRSLFSQAGWNPSRQETRRSLKSTWRRFSLRSVFVGITLLGVVLATRQYVVLGVLLGATIAIAGVVAVLIRRSFRSFLIGGVLGSYGFILGILLGDLLGQRFFPLGMARSYLLLSTSFGGLVLGALVAGIMERRHVRRELPRT